MLASSAMVLLMVPGLALFYGGMVRRKNVLTTMMMSFVAMAVIGVQWVLVGYALAFGKTVGGFFGWDWDYVAAQRHRPHAALRRTSTSPSWCSSCSRGSSPSSRRR